MAKKRKSKPKQFKRPERRQPVQRRVLPIGPKSYPPPAERERIIQRRDELLEKLIPILIASADGRDYSQALTKLAQKYGPLEVSLVLDRFQKTAASRDLLGETTLLYREYRQTFARFGGDRRFLKKQEYEALIMEHGILVGRRKFKSLVPFLARRSAREKGLYNLLLVGAPYWEDITPPAVPPRPPDFTAPPVGLYNDPVRSLLEWGWLDHESRLAAQAKDKPKWRPAIPELGQMVFDEGLLEGWPGEAASWGSYHALHLLGHLQAHEYAEKLLALLGRENDWLSDRLAVVWAQMGPPAEPPLWAYLADYSHDPENRTIPLLGLKRVAELHPKRRLNIINGLADLLRRAPANEAKMNGYLVHVLDRLQAVEAKAAILEAFDQDKVDPKIMQPGDVQFLYQE
jgi:hypothetical protein